MPTARSGWPVAVCTAEEQALTADRVLSLCYPCQTGRRSSVLDAAVAGGYNAIGCIVAPMPTDRIVPCNAPRGS
jgi:hypothetical protein